MSTVSRLTRQRRVAHLLCDNMHAGRGARARTWQMPRRAPHRQRLQLEVEAAVRVRPPRGDARGHPDGHRARRPR